MLVLGIETSCDETAAAIVDGTGTVHANIIASQVDEHRLYGGVVPEIAARSHLDHLDGIISQALTEAHLEFSDLDAVAVTGGPGLIGGVIVGVMTAKAIALAQNIPFIAVNHLEAHGLTVRLSHDVAFPYLLLLVSGGHCQLLIAEGIDTFHRLGTTIDDALGEAFDKTAKMLGLGYPGGPAVEQAAKSGDPARFTLPRPMKGRPGCDFSFSGLKTSIRQTVATLPPGKLETRDVNDLCASFQAAAGDVLVERCENAIKTFQSRFPIGDTLVVAGGVAANLYLRGRLEALSSQTGLNFVSPPIQLCTDNAAMVAWTGVEYFKQGRFDTLDFKPRPRWPLDPTAPSASEIIAGNRRK